MGLDPIGVQKLIDILKQWSSERQISMLISSHQLGELEALCSRYVYIESGELADAFEGKSHQVCSCSWTRLKTRFRRGFA